VLLKPERPEKREDRFPVSGEHLAKKRAAIRDGKFVSHLYQKSHPARMAFLINKIVFDWYSA
jgi:hypothetical protein